MSDAYVLVSTDRNAVARIRKAIMEAHSAAGHIVVVEGNNTKDRYGLAMDYYPLLDRVYSATVTEAKAIRRERVGSALAVLAEEGPKHVSVRFKSDLTDRYATHSGVARKINDEMICLDDIDFVVTVDDITELRILKESF